MRYEVNGKLYATLDEAEKAEKQIAAEKEKKAKLKAEKEERYKEVQEAYNKYRELKKKYDSDYPLEEGEAIWESFFKPFF